MRKNESPWLHQLQRKRQPVNISSHTKADIAVVGAGIAGVLTSYYILKQTTKNVVLIDADLAGHGASGHNAGQLTTYFERPLADIATEFGVDMACSGQVEIDTTWSILDRLVEDVGLATPIYQFTGYAGMTELKQLLVHLADNLVRHNGGIPIERMLIAKEYEHLHSIPALYSHLYELASQETILNLLETDNTQYIAVLAAKKGATNSAKICEELIVYMTQLFADRFSIFEYTGVTDIDLYSDEVVLRTQVKHTSDTYNISCHKVVLCTNGFEQFNIVNHVGTDINTRFHHQVEGVVNYMSAYLDQEEEDPIAISYFSKDTPSGTDEETRTGEQYFYITRRPHIHDGVEMGLISTGGPEKKLPEGETYNRSDLCEEWAEKRIDTFLRNNYKKHKNDIVEYDFCWHGLLGYTNTGLRMVGAEPLHERLLYNLGCNGIGIMPSLYGATKIADILSGKTFEPSIFDPRMQ
jgi:glycine/D-amino acid oxidase-like deaminating enzyme